MALGADLGEQDLLVDGHEVVFDVELEIPGPATAIVGDLADELLKAADTAMDALSPATGVRVVDEDWFPDGFQSVDQDVVHDPVSKVSRKDLAKFGLIGKKADRTAGPVSTVGKFCAQFQQFPFLIDLKTQGVDRVPFVPPAAQVVPVHIFKGEEQEVSLSGTNGEAITIVVLVGVVLVAVVHVEVPGVVRIGGILRTRPIPGSRLSAHFPRRHEHSNPDERDKCLSQSIFLQKKTRKYSVRH